MCCSAFSPEKKNGKRGFNMMVINGKLFVTNTVCCNSVHSGIIIQVITVASYCSEISCNVKWNVYLAMEIPDRVSFVSGQNSDEIVRSCELSW